MDKRPTSEAVNIYFVVVCCSHCCNYVDEEYPVTEQQLTDNEMVECPVCGTLCAIEID